jgi:hypothetical protein
MITSLSTSNSVYLKMPSMVQGFEYDICPPIKEIITESLVWLDRYLGPVGHK